MFRLPCISCIILIPLPSDRKYEGSTTHHAWLCIIQVVPGVPYSQVQVSIWVGRYIEASGSPADSWQNTTDRGRARDLVTATKLNGGEIKNTIISMGEFEFESTFLPLYLSWVWWRRKSCTTPLPILRSVSPEGRKVIFDATRFTEDLRHLGDRRFPFDIQCCQHCINERASRARKFCFISALK